MSKADEGPDFEQNPKLEDDLRIETNPRPKKGWQITKPQQQLVLIVGVFSLFILTIGGEMMLLAFSSSTDVSPDVVKETFGPTAASLCTALGIMIGYHFGRAGGDD